MTEREAFEAAIRDDPYDVVTRKVFADWLDENDETELADFQRSWTAARYDDAKKWMAEFAVEFGAYEGFDQFIEDIQDCVGDCVVMRGNGGDDAARSLRDDSNLRQKFWDSYQLISGSPLAEGVRRCTRFVCSC